MADQEYQNVKIERDNGVTFLYFNRPEKRNAMSPGLLADMLAAIGMLETDDDTKVLVLTGAGEAFTAGMDLKEFFRANDTDPAAWHRASRNSWLFHRKAIGDFPKPTIAMVNGWCFGGGFSPLASCDIAIAAEDATFGLSEVNWGIIPGGYVSKDVVELLSRRHAFYYTLTGEPFDGKRAQEIGLVTEAVPRERLRPRVMEIAERLKMFSPAVMRAAKQALHVVPNLSYDDAWDYLMAKNIALQKQDPTGSRDRGIRQFIDEKKFRPGLGPQPLD